MGLCIRCERCVISCPQKAIYFKGNQRLIDYSKCRGCLVCVNVCPRNAITVNSGEVGEVLSVDVIYDKCDNCGECATVCPQELWEPLEYETKEGTTKTVMHVPISEAYKCRACSNCVDACHLNIIKIQKYKKKEI